MPGTQHAPAQPLNPVFACLTATACLRSLCSSKATISYYGRSAGPAQVKGPEPYRVASVQVLKEAGPDGAYQDHIIDQLARRGVKTWDEPRIAKVDQFRELITT